MADLTAILLPFCLASGHFNHARYGLSCLRSMQRLHPDLLTKFMTGKHVMLYRNGLWNAVWTDLFFETADGLGHGPEGITGNTRNVSTPDKWALSYSVLTRVMNDLQEIREGGPKLLPLSTKKRGLLAQKKIWRREQRFVLPCQRPSMCSTPVSIQLQDL